MRRGHDLVLARPAGPLQLVATPEARAGHEQVEQLGARHRDRRLPGGRDDADDAGWLLTFLHDDAEDRSELVIVDATDGRSGPVARIATPQRVPYGFHAAWVPA